MPRSGPSPIYRELEVFARNEQEKLHRAVVDPWAFFKTGHTTKTTNFFGKEITYSGGIEFEGTPRRTFWGGLIEPFLEDLIARCLDKAEELAAKRGLRRRRPLEDMAALLRGAIGSTFIRMQQIDRQLRGGGYPDSVQPEEIETRVAAMERHLGDVLRGRLHRRPRPERLADSARNHASKIFVGVTIAVIVALIRAVIL